MTVALTHGVRVVEEMARLQGVGDADWALWNMGEVPSREMRDFIGNACNA